MFTDQYDQYYTDEDGERQTLERRKTSCGKVTNMQNVKGQLRALRGRNTCMLVNIL